MENVIKQIEEAKDMQDVTEIVSNLYNYAYQQGQLSMAKEVIGKREGLSKSLEEIEAELTEVTANVQEIEDKGGSHATGYKSPKVMRWTDELDSMLIAAAARGQETLKRLSSTDGIGVTLKALKSRLYKIGFVFKDGSWSKKEVA